MANRGNIWGNRGVNDTSPEHRTEIVNDKKKKGIKPETSAVSEEANRAGRGGGNSRTR